MWESCWTMSLAGGFSRGCPVSPAHAFLCCSTLGSHFMSCSGTMGTYRSQLDSPSLGGDMKVDLEINFFFYFQRRRLSPILKKHNEIVRQVSPHAVLSCDVFSKDFTQSLL
ncbi:hypothetical protein PR048_026427, partial [Dryococelus australis]